MVAQEGRNDNPSGVSFNTNSNQNVSKRVIFGKVMMLEVFLFAR